MSFASLLTHRVSIQRQLVELDLLGDPVLDDYGQPVTNPDIVSGVAAAIQPKSAREIALTSQAGAALSDHTIYLRPVHLNTGAAIVHDSSDCPASPDVGDVTFQIVGIRNAAGLGHHLEVDATLIESGVSDVAETGS